MKICCKIVASGFSRGSNLLHGSVGIVHDLCKRSNSTRTTTNRAFELCKAHVLHALIRAYFKIVSLEARSDVICATPDKLTRAIIQVRTDRRVGGPRAVQSEKEITWRRETGIIGHDIRNSASMSGLDRKLKVGTCCPRAKARPLSSKVNPVESKHRDQMYRDKVKRCNNPKRQQSAPFQKEGYRDMRAKERCHFIR